MVGQRHDRQTLYQMIWDFVEKNRTLNQFQMKKLGFSMDWTRYHYSLEAPIVKNVLATFKKLYLCSVNSSYCWRDF